ncbi:MAG TPA: hypothetical protein VNA30_00175, partial [Mycobacteriales bacterium]|nr:hypothetical protein [Mycobacteriales bacterium]
NVLFAAPLEKVHIAAVRGNIEATLVMALKVDGIRAPLKLGKVAYINDPVRTTSKDGLGFELVAGEKAKPYNVSRLTYFRDLARDARVAIPALAAADVAAGRGLAKHDSIVLADVEVPKDTKGRPVARSAYVKALNAFVTGGGQLVLTDRAVGLLPELGVVGEEALTQRRTNAGHVDFARAGHPFESGLFGKPSQTYYEVPLGFPARSQAPHYGVKNAAFKAAGGTVVGTVTADNADPKNATDDVVLGELPRGKGRITIFGALLPQPVESLESVETPHPEGLADYAVTIAGGTVLHNILSYRRGGQLKASASISASGGEPTLGAAAANVGEAGSLAATGLAATLPATAALALLSLFALSRRRHAVTI